MLWEGYHAAIFGLIFALSRRCCPHVILCHDQGGDLSLWQHLKIPLDVLAAPFRFLFPPWMIWNVFVFYIHIFLNAECQNIWFSQFVLVTFFFFFSLCVCFIAFSWMCAFSYASNTLSSRECLCFCQRQPFVCCHHLRVPVFTWLQKSVLLHLIQSMVWFIADDCLLPEEYDSRRKLKLRTVDKREKGRKKPGMWSLSNHPLSRGSIHPHPSLCWVCDIDTKCLPG